MYDDHNWCEVDCTCQLTDYIRFVKKSFHLLRSEFNLEAISMVMMVESWDLNLKLFFEIEIEMYSSSIEKMNQARIFNIKRVP
jgi:hypothetical protein